MKTQLTILAGITIVCSAWFYDTYQDSKLQQHQKENQTQLLQNYHELSKAQLELFREIHIKTLKQVN